ncbi:MAG: hypothetical protein JNK76_09315 [Planctomycetales bacterium]|nr:hypothetical protein [Planctomycetales bacterium]
MHAPTANAVDRYMLWIDGVGNYLMCERSSIAVGQPTMLGVRSEKPAMGDESVAAEVDVAIMADISRRHVLVERHGEHYLLKPLRRVWLGAAEVTFPRYLSDGTRFELGDRPGRGLQLRFDLPSSCGMTGRLVVESRHRLQPAADAVLLLADSCLIGPNEDCHVRVLKMTRTLVMHRRSDGQLVFRAEGSYDVDGRRAGGTTRIERSSRVRADDFSLQLEPLTR